LLTTFLLDIYVQHLLNPRKRVKLIRTAIKEIPGKPRYYMHATQQHHPSFELWAVVTNANISLGYSSIFSQGYSIIAACTDHASIEHLAI